MTLETLKKLFTFSWAQAFSDQNGKSSITAISAFYMVVIGGIGFLYGLFLKISDGCLYGLAFATLGAGLLGYRKGVDGRATSLDITEPVESPPHE